MRRLCASLLLSLGIASSASAVTMSWTPIGNAGNPCDPVSGSCYGAVGYSYSIGTYEVTQAQYVEFLNAKGESDPFGLYNEAMGSAAGVGSIGRSGVPGSYAYSVNSDRADKPVSYVSFYAALRFANWMNNGQGDADTETGAYTLLGGTPTPSNAETLTRSLGATIALTSEDEWFKAAYYDAALGTYYDYPQRSNGQPSCTGPSISDPYRANCWSGAFPSGFLTTLPVGVFTGSASPYGTFDQGGNVWEWNESLIDGSNRGMRGGAYNTIPTSQRSNARRDHDPTDYFPGFRLVLIPEPSTDLLVIAGLLGLAGWRRTHA